MSDSTVSALPTAAPAAAELLRAVLDVALTPILLLRPRHAAEGRELVDFALEYLNPAALRLGSWTSQPAGTLHEHFPISGANGVFAFFRRVFETGETGRYDFHYQTEGFSNYFEVAAQRQGEQLVASFLDTASHSRTTVEAALRASQAREQAARAEAEARQTTLTNVLEQAPIAMAILMGPAHVVAFANPRMETIWGRTAESLLNRPHFEALPDFAGQGFEAIFAGVYQTGRPYRLHELLVRVNQAGTGTLAEGYFNIVYQPLRDGQGLITGIVASAIEVTEQVRARQQVQQLNDELELRVAARTAEAQTALHEAEQQREHARAQQVLLGQILRQMPAAIATLMGPEHRYTFFNDAYQAISANRTVLGHTVDEVFPEVREQGFIALLDQVYTTGQPFISADTSVMLHNHATGQARQHYLDLIYQPLFNGQQQPQGILAFVLDVTDKVRARKQAETLQTAMVGVLKRQAQARQDLYQIFEQTPASIVLLREPDHRIDYFNPAFAELFPPEQWAGPLQGHTISEVYPRVKMAGLVKLLDKVYSSGESQVVLEMPLAELQPGSPRYVTFAYQAYREQGHIVGVAAFVYDVTEQVLARHQREAQQAELQRVFAQAPVPITILRGPEHTVELANEAVQAIWGRPAAQVLGQPYFEALPETADQGFEQIFADVLRTGQPHFVTEAPMLLHHAGGRRQGYVNFVFQPLFDEHRRTTGLMAMGIEVTDQVLARQQVQALNEEMQATNRELHDANQRLSRTNADLDTFVYTASHDLKAPIANIEGLLNALRDDLPAEVMQGRLVPHLLNLMQGSVARFQQTIGHLTDISQLQQPEAAETVDLADLIRNVQLDLAPLIEAASATLAVHVRACETVRMAPKTLRSVVYNLLSNAVKYRAPGRHAEVQLRAHCTPGQLVLEVQDNGLGLSETQQGQLFGMFRRLHTHVEGSGVGLFMVKRLIENADGTIEVRSQPDVGTTFTVTLPA